MDLPLFFMELNSLVGLNDVKDKYGVDIKEFQKYSAKHQNRFLKWNQKRNKC